MQWSSTIFRHMCGKARRLLRLVKAFEAWASKAGVTNAVISLGEIRHLDFDGGFAYLVAPVTLSYIKAGKPVDFLGMITMTLRKRESGWRISGVAWADQ